MTFLEKSEGSTLKQRPLLLYFFVWLIKNQIVLVMILWMKAFNFLKVKIIKIAIDNRRIKHTKTEL